MLNLNPGLVFVKDNKDKVIWVNNGMLGEIGSDFSSEIIGRSPSEFFSFVPTDKYALIDSEIIHTRSEQTNMIEIVDTPKSQQQILRIDKIPFIDPDADKCIGVITYVINITSSIQAKIEEYVDDVEYQKIRAATTRIISALKTKSPTIRMDKKDKGNLGNVIRS